MNTEEYSILILFGIFSSAIILLCIMVLALVRNNRPVNIVFSFLIFTEYFKMISEKKSTQSKVLHTSIIILFFLSIIMIPFSFSGVMPTMEEKDCMNQRRFDESRINELITGKFVDKANHATLSFWVMHYDSSSNAYGLNSYWKGIYDQAQPGDSLIKHRKSNVVTLRRKGKDLNYRIDYGCAE